MISCHHNTIKVREQYDKIRTELVAKYVDDDSNVLPKSFDNVRGRFYHHRAYSRFYLVNGIFLNKRTNKIVVGIGNWEATVLQAHLSQKKHLTVQETK